VATTRKVGAHYILLPGRPLVKNGHVLWRAGEAPLVVETGDVTREVHGIEFHGGMIVDGRVREEIRDWLPGDSITARVEQLYASRGGYTRGLALVQGADWTTLAWTDTSIVTRIL
jgi:hypothetical protein